MTIPLIVVVVAISALFVYLYKKEEERKASLERFRRALYITKLFGDTEITLYRCFKSRETLGNSPLVRAWVLAESRISKDRKTCILERCYNKNALNETEKEIFRLIAILPYKIDIVDYEFMLETLT